MREIMNPGNCYFLADENKLIRTEILCYQKVAGTPELFVHECEVVYFLSPVHAGYDLNPVGGFDCKPPSEFSLWSDLTIIGNIHDNPQLLKEGGGNA